MNIEIKPFIHKVRFTPPLVWRPLKKKLRLSKSSRQVWLPERHQETKPLTAEASRFF